MPKVALVTGGSRGIGAAVCERLGGLGWSVAVNYRQQAEAAEAVVRRVRAAGGQAAAVQGDVGQAADRGRMLEAVEQHWGGLDLLVNNAGITSPGRKDLLEVTEAGWEEVFATNLKGPFFLAQQAALRMIAGIAAGRAAGTIINVSSVSSYAVSTNRADYCLSKAALPMLTMLLADRLAEHGIQVFELCPGVIASDMTAPVREKYDQAIRQGLAPIRRWGQPEDVARAVAAIVEGYFPFSTGERFNIDGGFHIRRL